MLLPPTARRPAAAVATLLVLIAIALAGSAIVLAGSAIMLPALASADAPPVSVYPTPGDHYEQPATQITFRGVPAAAIGAVSVVGSVTGAHAGSIEADSDGEGGSFIPATPFSPGETVTVTTGLNIVGGSGGTFQFTIEQPAPPLLAATLPDATGKNSVQFFHSAPGLAPARLIVKKDTAPATGGDIFVAPQFGPTQNGPMILDPRGNLVWFDPIPIADKQLVTDFRVQELDDEPVLTWFQGTSTSGTGEGVGIIMNDHYQLVTTVHAGNGLSMDLHEFLITNHGVAYIVAVAPVLLPGISRPVLNSVVQEIDIATGLVLFQWDALDHVNPDASYLWGSTVKGRFLDPFHANSVSVDAAGNLVVSMRNTSAVYDINPSTGAINWEYGGRTPTFTMGSGTTTGLQHDVVVQPNGLLTMFDDGAGPPKVHTQSRAIEVAIDPVKKTATLVRQVTHAPSLLADFEGSAQLLGNGDMFVGWGQQPYFSEYTANGTQDFDARFATATASYRAYRFPWSGAPTTAPALVVGTTSAGNPILWESWNGATDVHGWRVFAGTSSTTLQPLGQYTKRTFESALVPGTGEPDVEVQAIGYAGDVIGTSPLVTVPNHVQIFGDEAFVPTNGLSSMPVACYSTTACKLSASVSFDGSVIAQTGRAPVAAGTGGLFYFRLSPAARATLARTGPIKATLTVTDAAGAKTASTPLTLNLFKTTGAGPARSSKSSAGLQIVASTTFVSSATSSGAVLVNCRAATPCRLTTTIAAGRTVIATSKPAWIGAQQLGYLPFTLSSAGQVLLRHAAGNQLPVTISVTGHGLSATSNSALVAYR